jgi:O-antigen/teichoic acid export membrane protein
MLFRQTLLYLPAQLFGPLFQFAAAIIWTHQLDATTYGVVTYLIAAQDLIALIVLGGWSAYVLRHRDELGERFGASLRRRDLMVISIASVVQLAAAVPILWSINISVTPALAFLTALFLITRSALAHYAEVCRSETAIGTFTIGQLASPVLGCSLSFIAVYYVGSDARAVLGALSFAQALGLLVVMRRLKVNGLPLPPDRALIRSAFSYAGPLIAAGAALWMGSNGIRLIVEHMSGPVELGLMSVGWGLGQRIAVVVAMLVTAAAFPLAVKRLKLGDQAEALRQVGINNVFILGLLAPMAMGTLIISTNLVNLVIAQPFRATTLVIFPIATITGALRNFAQHGAGQTYLLVSRTDLTLKVDLADAAMTLSACAIGLYFGGVTGAAIGCMISAIAWLILTFAIAISIGLPIMVGHSLRILVATFAMGAALSLVNWPAGIVGLIAAIGCGGLIYGLALALLFEEARKMLPAILKRVIKARSVSAQLRVKR